MLEQVLLVFVTGKEADGRWFLFQNLPDDLGSNGTRGTSNEDGLIPEEGHC